MTKIIGHRGAAGLVLENTRASLQTALKYVDAIEIDVRLTRDGRLVLAHDAHTGRIASQNLVIADHTLQQLQAVPLKDGQTFLELGEALDIVGTLPLIIEIKDAGSADELVRVLGDHPQAQASFASFLHSELRQLRAVLPSTPSFALEHFKPTEIVNSARHIGATGIGLNAWLMNPLTYRLARRAGLELYVYTVNLRWLGRFLLRLYPHIWLCSDHPERFVRLRARTASTTSLSLFKKPRKAR